MIRCPACGRGVSDDIPDADVAPASTATPEVAGGAGAGAMESVPAQLSSAGGTAVSSPRTGPVGMGAPQAPAAVSPRRFAGSRTAAVGLGVVGGLLLLIGAFLPILIVSFNTFVGPKSVVTTFTYTGIQWFPGGWIAVALGITVLISAIAGKLTQARAMWTGIGAVGVIIMDLMIHKVGNGQMEAANSAAVASGEVTQAQADQMTAAIGLTYRTGPGLWFWIAAAVLLIGSSALTAAATRR